MLGNGSYKGILTNTDNATVSGNYNFTRNVSSAPQPTLAQHLANKSYVDQAIASSESRLTKKIEESGGGTFESIISLDQATLSTLWTIYRNQILTPNGEIGVKFVGQSGFRRGSFSDFGNPEVMFGKDMRLTNPVGHDTLALLVTISGNPPEYRVVYYVDDKAVVQKSFTVSPGYPFTGFHSDGVWGASSVSNGGTDQVTGTTAIFLKKGQTLSTNLPILYRNGKLYGCSTGLFLKIN